MPRAIGAALAAFLLASSPATSIAGPCDATFSFDGSLADSSGSGNDGRMVGQKGVPASPQFVDGKFGQALLLDGSSAMRAFIDLNPTTCQQITIAAWVQIEPTTSTQTIISAGGGTAPGLRSSKKVLVLSSTGNGLHKSGVVEANAGWMFIAGVWDYENNVHRLYWRNSGPLEGTIGKKLSPSSGGIWVGASNDKLMHAPKRLLVDNLTIVGRALTKDELLAIQTSGPDTQQRFLSGPLDTTGTCSSDAECPTGGYCAMDHKCHPNDHLPISVAETGNGMTLAELNAQLAEQNTGMADAIDYESPTDLLTSGGTSGDDIESAGQPPEPAGSTGQSSEPEEVYTGGHHPGETVVTSELSGHYGQVIKTIDLRSKFFGQIVWAERGRIPCRISVRNVPHQLTQTLEYCEYSNAHHVEVTPFVRSMRVCNDGDPAMKRLMGLQIWAAGIRPDGRVDLSEADLTAVQGCVAWGQVVRCPASHLATGLEVHSVVNTADDEIITGLKLVCREVTRDY